MDWSDLKLILAIGRSGSLSGAARLLDINHSTVFRRINAIEKEMGVRFFERLPQGYVMTEAGESAMRAGERIDSEVTTLTREIHGKDLQLQGTIRVTAPFGLSLTLLTPLLAQFSRSHPDIHIDLIATSATLSLSRREADLALRVTTRPPDTSVGRRICSFRSAIYATRQYLNKHRDTPLQALDWLLTDDQMDWLPLALRKPKEHASLNIKFSSNNVLAVMHAARQGIGVSPLPCFLGDSDKKLQRVVEPLDELSSELWILTHSDLRNTARVRILMSFLYEGLSEQSRLFAGE